MALFLESSGWVEASGYRLLRHWLSVLFSVPGCLLLSGPTLSAGLSEYFHLLQGTVQPTASQPAHPQA